MDNAKPVLPSGPPIEGQGEIHINVLDDVSSSSSPQGSIEVNYGEIQIMEDDDSSTSRARKSPPDSPPIKNQFSSQAGSKPPPTKSTLVSNIGYSLNARFEPLLLLKSAGKKSCCIFKVPDRLVEVNPKAYTPKIVSIGPYHYGETHLQMIQEHKLRFLQLFLNKSREQNVKDDDLYAVVWGMKEKMRASYSTYLEFEDSKLVAMVILDGIFIVTLLLITSNIIVIKKNTDPIFTSSWIIPSIRTDLLLLENQVPFFILETLFEKSKIAGKLKNIAFDFFNLSLSYEEKHWKGHTYLKPKHLLDLLRNTFLPQSRLDSIGTQKSDETCLPRSAKSEATLVTTNHSCMRSCFRCRKSSDSAARLIFSAKKLRLKGIHIKVRSDADSMLDIRLRNNYLYIPRFRMDGFITSFFLNCVAFEQLGNVDSSHITSYVVFMGNLLHNEEDAVFLSNEKRIIENYFGEDIEVSHFFKTVTKAVVFNLEESYLKDACKGVNEYTSRWYSGQWSGFKHTHFESPWTFMSSLAVVIALVITGLGVFIAYLSYQNDLKNNGKTARS